MIIMAGYLEKPKGLAKMMNDAMKQGSRRKNAARVASIFPHLRVNKK